MNKESFLKNSVRFTLPFVALLAFGCAKEIKRGVTTAENIDSNTNRLANELEHDRQYIESISKEISLLTKSISELSEMGKTMFETILMNMGGVKEGDDPNSAGTTDDIDDILDEKIDCHNSIEPEDSYLPVDENPLDPNLTIEDIL